MADGNMVPEPGTGITTPRPDPTVATTDALRREVASLRELFDAQFAILNEKYMALAATLETKFEAGLQGRIAVREILETRLNGMDRAITLIQATVDKTPSTADLAIRALRDVQDEKFMGIATQFIERDKRTDQLTLASSTAIAAALQAQKEAAGETQKSSSLAIAKSEASTADSIRQLQALFQTSIMSVTEKINALQSRIDRGEGGTAGSRESASNIGGLILGGFSFISMLMAVGAIILAFTRHA
jgi:hypothetical protein